MPAGPTIALASVSKLVHICLITQNDIRQRTLRIENGRSLQMGFSFYDILIKLGPRSFARRNWYTTTPSRIPTLVSHANKCITSKLMKRCTMLNFWMLPCILVDQLNSAFMFTAPNHAYRNSTKLQFL